MAGLPFEEDGLPFENELPFEKQTSSEGNFFTDNKDDRDTNALLKDFSDMSLPRRIGEGMVGVPETALNLATGMTTGFAAKAGGVLAGLATGEGLEGAIERGNREGERFTYKPRSTGGQLEAAGVGHAFEKAIEGAGRFAERTFTGKAGAAASGNHYPSDPLVRTLTEAGIEAAMVAGPVHAVKRRMEASREAIAKAKELVETKMKGETEYHSWENLTKEWQDYQAALRDLDNEMIKYKDDLQAPQLGGGGKVARPPDAVGRAQRGDFAEQVVWDEEMRKTGQDHDQTRFQQDEFTRQNPVMLTPESMLDTSRRPVADKTNIKGPEGELLTDPQAIANETRGLMSPRDAAPKPRLKATGVLDEPIDAVGIADDVSAKMRARQPLDNPQAIVSVKRGPNFAEEGGYDVHLSDGSKWTIFRSPDNGYWYIDPMDTGKHHTENFLGFTKKEALESLDRKVTEGLVVKQTPKIKADGWEVADNTLTNPHYNVALEAEQRNPNTSTARRQLRTIADTSKNPIFREVARILGSDIAFNPEFAIHRNNGNDAAAGLYFPGKYRYELQDKFVGDERLTLHELAHARTHGAIEGVLRGVPGFEHLKLPVRRLQDLYTAFQKAMADQNIKFDPKAESGTYGTTGRNYGLMNIHEFVAEGWTQPQLQSLMVKTKLPTVLQRPGMRNYWDTWVDRISKLIGFDRMSNDFFAEFVRTTAEIMENAKTPERRVFTDGAAKGLSSPTYGAYGYKDFKADLTAKGIKLPESVMKKIYDEQDKPTPKDTTTADQKSLKTIADVGLRDIQQQYIDPRKYEEVKPDIMAAPDMSAVDANVIAKGLNGRFTASDHPLWQWISSKIHEVKNAHMQRAADKLHGKSRQQPDPGTYNYVWKQLTAKEREMVNELGWEFNNKDSVPTTSELNRIARERFGQELTEKQLQAYKDRIRINHEVLDDVNKKLMEEGKDPIPGLPNYWSPIVLNDPFVVKFMKDGETVKIAGFYRKPNLAKLIEAFPEFQVELAPERGMRKDLDFDQLDWLLRQLHKEQRDPAALAITEGLRRQGFMKHGLKRKGVEGGTGSEGGRRGLRNYEETSEKYIRQAYDWLANRKLDEMYKHILDDKDLDSKPYAKTFALESIDTARGGTNEVFDGLSKMVGEVVSGTIHAGTLGVLDLPNRFAKDTLKLGNKVMTTMLLGFFHPTNIAANGMQAWAYAPPQLLAMGARNGLNMFENGAAVFRALTGTMTELGKWDSSKDVQKLRAIGALDPTFKYDWSTYASDSDPRYQNTLIEHATGISLLSKLEQDAVRRPAALMFTHMLREIGYDKIAKTPDELYYVAKEMTDKYMVSMKWYEKPHMFSRTGMAGTAFSPLQNFTVTWMGMLREYSKLSAEGLLDLTGPKKEPGLMPQGIPDISMKDYIAQGGSKASYLKSMSMGFSKQLPIIAFLGVNVATAGILGIIGVKEWDAIAHLLNKMGLNVQSGSEWVMSTFKDPKMRFGLLSDALGYHVGATFNAPTLTGSFAPGLQMGANVANFGMQAGRQMGANFGLGNAAPTSTEMREAVKGITPRFSPPGLSKALPGWGETEQRFTPSNMPYRDQANNAMPITRTEEDWTARKWGTYTNKEVADKTEWNIAERSGQERQARLSKGVDRMIDILLDDRGNHMKRIEPLIQALEKDQFGGKEIQAALKRELYAKALEADVKAQGKLHSTKQQHIAKLLQELR